MEKFIREDQYAQEMRTTVLPYIASRRADEQTPSYDGKLLHVVTFRADAPRAEAIIVHGFTESVEKYHEVVYYLLTSGMNVTIYEQRGHGRSYRAVSDPQLTHIDDFDEYIRDLEGIVRRVKGQSDLPTYLIGHSMGGAVSALYLEKHPTDFDRAVLLSPMIAPATGGFPAWVAKLVVRTAVLCGKGKKRLFNAREYPGVERFEESCSSSEARFQYYNEIKSTHPEYQNYSASYRWLSEAFGVTKKILKKGAVEKIGIPLLLVQAMQDNVVLPEPQNRFVSRLPHGRIVRADCKHESFDATDDVWQELIGTILDFLS